MKGIAIHLLRKLTEPKGRGAAAVKEDCAADMERDEGTMRARTVYECDMCRKQYRTEKEASECEKNHHKPEVVSRTNFYKDDIDGYPSTVSVGFENGEIRLYEWKRTGGITFT